MAGRVGKKKVWQRNLKIVWIDVDKSLLFVKGSIPGANGNLVKVIDSFYTKKNQNLLNYPTFTNLN